MARLAAKLWAALDGPHAQRVTRLCIFVILVGIGIAAYLTRGWTAYLDQRLDKIEVRVAAIPEMSRKRDGEIAMLHGTDDRLIDWAQRQALDRREDLARLEELTRRVSHIEGRLSMSEQAPAAWPPAVRDRP